MTPALKAMVEAIMAEFERQADEDGSSSVAERGYYGADPDRLARLDGGFDLEKVARAGLAAISRSSIADNAFTWESRDPMASLEQSKRGVSFRQMIRAILGEKP